MRLKLILRWTLKTLLALFAAYGFLSWLSDRIF